MKNTSLDEIFRAHHKELEAYLRCQTNCQDTVADLVQDTFIRFKPLYEKPPGIQQVRAYLFRIAHNLVIDHFRKMRAQPADLMANEDFCDLVEDGRGPEQAVDFQQRLQVVSQAVDALPPRCREVFLLVRVHDMNYVEVSEKLGISPKTVFAHMTKALCLLKSTVDENLNF